MGEVAVLVPVLDRPHRVAPLLRSLQDTSPEAEALFICTPGDMGEIEAVKAAGAGHILIEGNYATKIRAGVEATSGPLVFTAADDLLFRRNWLEVARGYLEGGIEVVGVNDLLSRPHRPEHATHFLMTRSYAEAPTADGCPGPFFDGYHHWACDDELIATAKARHAYAYAADSIVEHLHHQDGRAPDDDTYLKGRSNARADLLLFRRRARRFRWT